MACDIMGAGSRAKGKDRAEERDRTSDVSRQACREAQWGWGEQVGSALVFFFIFHSHLDNQGKNGGVLWTLREPFSFRDLSPCGNRECLPSFTVTF